MKTVFLRRISALVMSFMILLVCWSAVFADAPLRVARIKEFSGKVEVFKAGGEKSFPAFVGMGLAEGDSIITGMNSWVVLQIDDDKEAKIGENSRMGMSELRGSVESGNDQTGLSLWVGKIWTKIKEKLNVNSKYEIKTPTTVMGVRGTKFFVSEEQGKTYVAVIEGRLYAVKIVRSETGDGIVEEKQLEAFIEANEQLTLDELVQFDDDIVVEPVTIESLDLMVLEEIKNDPEGVDPKLLENIDEVIESKRQELEEQRQKLEEQLQQDLIGNNIVNYAPQTGRPSSSSSGSSSPGTDPSETDPPVTDPQFVGNPYVEAAEDSATLFVQTNAEGIVYYLVLKEEHIEGYAPQNAAELVDYNPDAEGAPPSSWSGSSEVWGQTVETVEINDLEPGVSYRIYIVFRDNSGNLTGITEVPFSIEEQPVEEQPYITIENPTNGSAIEPHEPLSLWGKVVGNIEDLQSVVVRISKLGSGSEPVEFDAEIFDLESGVVWSLEIIDHYMPYGYYTAEVTAYFKESEDTESVSFIVTERPGFVENVDTFYHNGKIIFNISFDTAVRAILDILYYGESVTDWEAVNESGEQYDWLVTIDIDDKDGYYTNEEEYSYAVVFLDGDGEELGTMVGNIPAVYDITLSFTQNGSIELEGSAYLIDRVKVTVEDSENEIIHSSNDGWNQIYYNSFGCLLGDPRDYVEENGVYDIVLTVDDYDDDFGIVIGYIIKTDQGITLKERTW
ncbi:MAG: FecR domain-containing protein [Acetivibrionales bacterium]|jgi:hypothetical protein